MLARLMTAAFRGICVAFLVALPSLLLPESEGHSSELVVFMALMLGGLIFVEYVSQSPSILEFRDAPPLNRNRFLFVGLCALLLSLQALQHMQPTSLTALVSKFAMILGHVLDFAFSPVKLLVWAIPQEAPAIFSDSLRAAGGLAYALSLLSVGVFAIMIRGWNWPLTNGPFNVWVNLPLFDPTTGKDVVVRLQRDGRLHIAIGIILPFVLPALVRASPMMMQHDILDSPQMLVWCVTGWAMVPAGLIIRGMARLRVAELIVQKRRSYGRDDDYQIA